MQAIRTNCLRGIVVCSRKSANSTGSDDYIPFIPRGPPTAKHFLLTPYLLHSFHFKNIKFEVLSFNILIDYLRQLTGELLLCKNVPETESRISKTQQKNK